MLRRHLARFVKKREKKKDTFEIGGYVETPYYLTFEKGTSTLGNGTVSVSCFLDETKIT